MIGIIIAFFLGGEPLSEEIEIQEMFIVACPPTCQAKLAIKVIRDQIRQLD